MAFATYMPDHLLGRPVRLSRGLVAEAAEVEALVRELNAAEPTSPHLESFARFLLRSEAVASSRIENVVASARAIALLELMMGRKPGEAANAKGIGEGAREVVNNVLALREAVSTLTETAAVTADDIHALQAALFAGTEVSDLSGRPRDKQSWVGGDISSPRNAEFVPPPPAAVPDLLDDLAAFLSKDHPHPLVHAALVHAQFETIHPYFDGNGRTGRALIHTALARQGIATGHVLPISLSLLAHPAEYISGLSAYRYVGAPDSPAAINGTEAWVRVFVAATRDAVAEAERFTDELTEMRFRWDNRLADFRESQGLRPQPRKGAAVLRLMEQLPGVPIVTARAAEALLKVTFPAASSALEELVGAGILSVKDPVKGERGERAFLATEVLDLINGAEQRLRYTRWDLSSK
ncbi:Fic family protein [Streptomyces sp. NPDC004549]|uniref:Fic family protein n=1 Tax=Streptomyces sp. NPDC004549 TaxID=3154283 RepID=UPI0033B186E0